MRLVEAAIGAAVAAGAERLVVHSTDVAIPLYRRAGFRMSDRLLQLDLPASDPPPGTERGAAGAGTSGRAGLARLAEVSQQKEHE
jgi:hypothetical protein